MKCAIYTRVSTDNQAGVEFNSCEAQESKIRSFIKSQENMEIFKVYSDPGFSGASLNRPALREMLNDIKESKINLVISYKIDRLTRSIFFLLHKYRHTLESRASGNSKKILSVSFAVSTVAFSNVSCN